MRKDNNQEYTSPVLESINLEVEKGFAQSGGYGEKGTAVGFSLEDITEYGEF